MAQKKAAAAAGGEEEDGAEADDDDVDGGGGGGGGPRKKKSANNIRVGVLEEIDEDSEVAMLADEELLDDLDEVRIRSSVDLKYITILTPPPPFTSLCIIHAPPFTRLGCFINLSSPLSLCPT